VCLLPEYQFLSKDMTGKSYKGTLEAESVDAFYHLLSERNQFCVSVREAGAASKPISITPQKLKLKELAIFSRQFSTMLSSGLTVIKCLDVLYQQTTGKFLKSTILGVYEAVQKGDSLSKAMKSQKGAFPPLFLSMVAAGEAGGSLDNVMLRMADQYEKDNKLHNKITQALIYPAFLVALITAVVILLLVGVLPRFMSMFNEFGGTVPAPTRILLAVSGALTNYWYIIIAVIALIAVLWNAFLKSTSGRMWWDRLKIKVPVIGKLLLIIASSRFSRTFASLFNSGLPIVQSLEIVGGVLGNKYIESKIQDVGEDVRRGVSLSAAVRKTSLFPPMLCSMLTIGEESGNLDEILNKTSAFYDEESEAAIQKLIALIEPVMIVVLAVIVGFIIISVMLPIFTIYNSVGASGG
jgi:type IV pilus assembly protein PilC